ncbi:hypothetical protein BHM03_00030467 [Ensete ventricosum]|nr:hypothetical protein BHM03_00030467 [Ensete ventricosum]
MRGKLIFCFDFCYACDSPAISFPTVVSELSEGSHCKGQPGMAMANPLARAADHVQGGGRQRPGPLHGATDYSQGPQVKGRPTAASTPAKGRPTAARASLQGGDARPRPDRRGNRPRVAGCSAALVRGGSRPRPRRRGCCQRSVDGCPRPARKGRPTAGLAPARAATSSGSACRGDARGGVGRRGDRPLAERLPPGKCSVAACTGQRRRRRWGKRG